jgi:hypothetical protein
VLDALLADDAVLKVMGVPELLGVGDAVEEDVPVGVALTLSVLVGVPDAVA